MIKQDILLGADGDLAIVNFDFKITDETNVVAQRIKRAVSLFKGEYWLDIDLGVPYYEEILGTKNALDTVQAILINAIRDVKGVKDILSFDIKFDDKTRQVSIETTIKDALDNEIELKI